MGGEGSGRRDDAALPRRHEACEATRFASASLPQIPHLPRGKSGRSRISFGAGYSSFKTLRSLGVDIVKIDGGFVENLASSRDDQAFVRTLIDLARAFGLKTVAERVQDEESAAILTEWGVDYLQGNLTGQATLDWPEAVAEKAS